jgi:hypothetical protein
MSNPRKVTSREKKIVVRIHRYLRKYSNFRAIRINERIARVNGRLMLVRKGGKANFNRYLPPHGATSR